MKRIIKILGIAIAIAALLVVTIGSTVFAANGNGPNGLQDGDGPIGGQGPFGSYGPDGNGENGNGPHGLQDGDGPIGGQGPFGPYGPNVIVE